MSLDIKDILNDWPYHDGRVNARRISGDDGRPKIQLRLDLGVLQMEANGRPDGKKPHGFDSLLEYQEDRLAKQNGQLDLEPDDCEALRDEAMMYYHRYLAEFVLGQFDAVIRDTNRNLKVFDLCRDYASAEADQIIIEQYRPYVIMMNARARAHMALRANRMKAAVEAVQRGIGLIEQFYHDLGQEGEVASGELAMLVELRDEMKSKMPVNPLDRLRERLARAIKEERYEEAAQLHKTLRRAEGQD